MIATVTTLLPIVSNKKVDASGNNQRLWTLLTFRAPGNTNMQTRQCTLLTVL